MALNVPDNAHYYNRTNTYFSDALAAMKTLARNQSVLRNNMSITVPTRFNCDGQVYAAPLPAVGWSSQGAWAVNSGGVGGIYQAVTQTITATAATAPFIICVTYDSFKNIPAPAVTQWRGLGVNSNESDTSTMWGLTADLISTATQGEWLYITGIYVFDNSNDGNYSAESPRAELNNYNLYTFADISEIKLYRGTDTLANTATGINLFTLYNHLRPYTYNERGATWTGGRFDILSAGMRALGMPISAGINIVGINGNNNNAQIANTKIYPDLDALKIDVASWGVPYTFDLNTAQGINTPDFPDTPTPPGVPTNPTGGGGGTGNNISDPINLPVNPFSPSTLGGYSTLLMNSAELEKFSDVLWKPVIRDLTDVLKVYFNTDNLTNAVMSIMFYPLNIPQLDPASVSHSDALRIAWSTDDISADIMSGTFKREVDAGSYFVEEYYGSFLDFAPYTTAEIWLPYIGYKPLDIDSIMSKTVSVKYFIDFITGMGTAVIFADGQPINTYTGVIGIDLAVTGRDFSAKIRQTVDAVMTSVTGVNKSVSGVLQGSAQTVAGDYGAAAGSFGSIPNNIMSGVSAMTQTALQQPSTVVYGTAGGENWLSLPQRCHLKFTRTVSATPSDYQSYLGYPSTFTAKVSAFTDFLKVKAVHGDFSVIPAEHASEIEQLLKSGVYITKGAFD